MSDINTTSRNIIEAGDKDLRAAGGKDFVAPFGAFHFQSSYDDRKVGKNDDR